jgi:predicted GH43/DUF377 family glycosyl hydrolase
MHFGWLFLAYMIGPFAGSATASDPAAKLHPILAPRGVVRQDAAQPAVEFPAELVDFVGHAENPIFTGRGAGFWDAKIRERGWILRERNQYHLWFTGYDGSRNGLKQLGYATSRDGISWERHSDNPIYRDHWVEDMMVVKQGDTYFMFAEGAHDEAQLLTSTDGIHWVRTGKLDVRYRDGQPLTPGPYGTPTAWFEQGTWHLFYERNDLGVWLATSKDMKVWTNLQDEPVLRPGPDAYDAEMIALNQILKYQGRYFAFYHGSGAGRTPRQWCTNLASSPDLVHWNKYPKNPVLSDNKSSGIVVHDGMQFRLYTMHDRVDLHWPRQTGR